MTTKHITIIASLTALSAVAACGYHLNPCLGALYNGLSDEEQTNCDECDNYETCEPDHPPIGLLSCADAGRDAGMPFCIEIDSTKRDLDWPQNINFKPEWCESTSLTFNHLPTWSDDALGDHQVDTWCAGGAGEGAGGDTTNQFGADYGHQLFGKWKLCVDNAGHTFPAVGPLSGGENGGETGGLNISEWTEAATCPNGASTVGLCELDLVAIGGDMMAHDAGDYTCTCSSDSDCPGSMLCIAGPHFDFMMPTPSMCSFPDATPNGSAPDGAVVYGLAAWEDGIVIEDGVISITTKMLLTMHNTGALLGDGQRFGVIGLEDGVVQVEVTACAPEALCGHIGLTAGDQVHAPLNTVELLEAGLPADVLVLMDGEPEYWTVQVSDI